MSGINFNDTDNKAGATGQSTSSFSWQNFTPTVTLVGGAGNVVPQYSTNAGRYLIVGKIVFVDILLAGDGGNEGAGTGQINVALPIAAGSNSVLGDAFPAGHLKDGTLPGSANTHVLASIIPSATTAALYQFTGATTTANATGADQATANRTIRLHFSYEIN